MIKKLTIENFKSVKKLDLDCAKINIFIGEPNTGKSNILEALGLLSHAYYHNIQAHISNFVRMEDMTNLFYERTISNPVKISFNGKSIELKSQEGNFVEYYNNKAMISFGINGQFKGRAKLNGDCSGFKYYRFKISRTFPEKKFPEFLVPPHGSNLASVLFSNKELRKLIGDIITHYDLKLIVRPLESRVELQQEAEGIAISYPYDTVSDTLQRLVFFISIIETSKDSVIMLEEPGSHAFPYYTKYLGELITHDQGNQYFISTHNPYFLLSIVEKGGIKDTKVYLTYLEDHQTKLKSIDLEQVLDLEHDIFFNIERLLSQ